MYKRIKKDTKWTIMHLGIFKIDSIKKELMSYSDEWLIDTSRQKMGHVHSNTQMFRICETDYYWIPNTEINTVYSNSLKTEEANKELNDIFAELEEYYSGKVIRCEFIKMLPNSKVLRHTDGGPILHYSRRVHVPIITSPKITFTVMDNTINMKESEWYEINNQMPHEVDNPTDLERIHMIIDILPDEMLYFNQGDNK